jgi:hypothetical protein
VSNPVVPPPGPEGSYPPPANQGFGAAPTPGNPQGQPSNPQGQPGNPQGQPGYPQQGFGDAPGWPTAPAAKKKSGVGRVFLRIGAAVLVAIAIFGVKSLFFSTTDKAKDAAVGDCIASSKQVEGEDVTDATAKVVDCASAAAAFTVVGRVNGETDVKSKSCDKFFKENEQFFVYAADNGATGYLLCLRSKS